MKNALIVIGEELTTNEFFIEYIKREARKKSADFCSTILLNSFDKNLITEMDNYIERFLNILIVTSAQNYNIVTKVIATLLEDTLSLENNILVPSKSQKVSKNSFLVTYRKKNINVIQAKPAAMLPTIFFDSFYEIAILHFFNKD